MTPLEKQRPALDTRAAELFQGDAQRYRTGHRKTIEQVPSVRLTWRDRRGFDAALARWVRTASAACKSDLGALRLIAPLAMFYANAEKGFAWPSNERLASDVGVDVRTVKAGLSTLQRRGMIQVDTGPRRRAGGVLVGYERRIYLSVPSGDEAIGDAAEGSSVDPSAPFTEGAMVAPSATPTEGATVAPTEGATVFPTEGAMVAPIPFTLPRRDTLERGAGAPSIELAKEDLRSDRIRDVVRREIERLGDQTFPVSPDQIAEAALAVILGNGDWIVGRPRFYRLPRDDQRSMTGRLQDAHPDLFRGAR